MTLTISLLLVVAVGSLALLERRLEFLINRDDADKRMDVVNDRRTALAAQTSNTLGIVLAAAIVIIGYYTFCPAA